MTPSVEGGSTSSLAVLGPGLAVVGLLVLVSAFFSSSESAIFSLPAEWVEGEATAESPGSRALADLHADPHRLLVTLLVGNNLVNVAITSILTLLVAQYVPPGPTVLLATVVASVLILVCGEIVPKSYGLGHARSWSRRVARPLVLVGTLLWPVVVLFDGTTRRLTRLLGGDADIEEQYLDE